MTIRDVAARAGVSAATVSRVFSRPESVTLETRRRVLTAAEHLRYTPHPVARSLARGDTGNLGLVVPDIAVAFCAVVTKAVSQRARRDGYALFVADSDEPSTGLTVDDLRSAHAMAKQVDGLLLLSPTAPDDDLRALAATVPLVVINRELAEVPTVLMPSADGAVSAVEHLHALGHRRLAYLAGPDNYSNHIRTAAFTRTCRPARRRRHRHGPVRADVLGRCAGGRPRPGRRGDRRARLQRRRGRGGRRSAHRPGRARAGPAEHRRVRRHRARLDDHPAPDDRPAAHGGRGRGRGRPARGRPCAGHRPGTGRWNSRRS